MLHTRSSRWRSGFFCLALFCLGSIAFALLLQFRELAPPCPLCIFQRLGILLEGLLALLAVIFLPRAHACLWPVMLSLTAVVGGGISIRHIYIQNAAASGDTISACGPGLNYLLRHGSLPDVITSVLTGHGDCTVIDWQFMGITLPMLALAGFCVLAAGPWMIRRWSLSAPD